MTAPSDSSTPAPSGAGVIANRHIPRDWQRFYVEHHDNRMPRLCGSRGISKYEGIPGITPQNLGVEDRPGWCINCIDRLFDFYNGNYKKIVTIPEAHEVYNIVFFEMMRFMRFCIDNAERLGIPLQDNGQNLT